MQLIKFQFDFWLKDHKVFRYYFVTISYYSPLALKLVTSYAKKEYFPLSTSRMYTFFEILLKFETELLFFKFAV